MRRLSQSIRLQIWMTLLFGFGTIFWYLASLGKAWFFAHIVSFLFLALAVLETFGKRRPLLIGILLGLSFWSRLPVILSLPFFLIMLSDMWFSGDKELSLYKRINLRPLILLGLGVGIFVFLHFLYNYVRFDTISNIAYTIQAKEEPWFYPKGLFDISYIKKHLEIFFIKPPAFQMGCSICTALDGRYVYINNHSSSYICHFCWD